MSLQAGQDFIAWLRDANGQFDRNLELRQDESGISVRATGEIAAESTLISCPFELAITPSLALKAISALYDGTEETAKGWSERMLVATYLALHWIQADKAGPTDASWPKTLRHWPYIAVLPSRTSLKTPSYFTTEERRLLVGTNLFGVVDDREKDLREEMEVIRAVVGEMTWERYLDATTYISSRAFPSKLLSVPTSGEQKTDADKVEEETSYPVIIPGLDLFNHSRGTPITWLSSPISSAAGSTPSVSFLNPQPISPNTEVYNNYGPKSNEELLLSYGFVLSPNPDDTVILRLGAPEAVAAQLKAEGVDVKQRFAVRKDGEIPQELLKTMRVMMGGKTHEHGDGCGHDHAEDDDGDDEDGHAAHEKEMEEMELEMDVLGTLGGMLEDKLGKLRVELEAQGDVREDVRQMCEVYRSGQIEIIEATLDKLAERTDRLEGLVDQGSGACPCGC